MEEYIAKTKSFLSENNISFDVEIPFTVRLRESEEIRTGEIKDVVHVSFSFQDVFYDDTGNITHWFENGYGHAYYDAETTELLYIMDKHGYIEPNGER